MLLADRMVANAKDAIFKPVFRYGEPYTFGLDFIYYLLDTSGYSKRDSLPHKYSINHLIELGECIDNIANIAIGDLALINEDDYLIVNLVVAIEHNQVICIHRISNNIHSDVNNYRSIPMANNHNHLRFLYGIRIKE